MYQSNIPLTYENLAMYNSQLPYPKFNFSVHEGMNVGASTADTPGSGGSTPPQVSSPSYSTTPPQSQPQEEDDDFGDFVDSNVEVPQPPPKELTEEEKKKKEEEDRLKRLDLISSAFDDALFEDEKPPEKQKAEVKATTEFQQTANQPMEVDQNHASQEESKVEHQKQEDMGWANFASTEPPQDVSTTSWREDAAPGWGAPTFSEDNKKDEDAKEEDAHDFGDFEDPVQEPPAHEDPKEKPQASPLDDDPFAEIDMEVQKESEQEEGAIPDSEPQLETKKSGGESFPSLFNAASTPRVDNDMDSDIRMSFPSQEMWGNSFSGPNKDNLEKEKSEKEITNTGWASGAFEFKPSEPAKDIIQEDDKEDEGFQDIMDLKDDKKHQEDTGF